VYLIHTDDRGGRSSPARMLYWFRSPPGVKVGREPFDEGVRQALEAAYPTVAFDWKRIASTPMPPQEAETWRERRRAERAARRARTTPGQPQDAPRDVESPGSDAAEGSSVDVSSSVELSPIPETDGAASSADAAAGVSNAEAPQRAGRRRRRRGNRRRRGEAGNPVPAAEAATPLAGSNDSTHSEPERAPAFDESDSREEEEG